MPQFSHGIINNFCDSAIYFRSCGTIKIYLSHWKISPSNNCAYNNLTLYGILFSMFVFRIVAATFTQIIGTSAIITGHAYTTIAHENHHIRVSILRNGSSAHSFKTPVHYQYLHNALYPLFSMISFAISSSFANPRPSFDGTHSFCGFHSIQPNSSGSPL